MLALFRLAAVTAVFEIVPVAWAPASRGLATARTSRSTVVPQIVWEDGTTS